MNTNTSSTSRNHILAIKLNNRGVYCMENNRYDEAIRRLMKALQLSEEVAFSSNSSVGGDYCQCNCCTLEECMKQSQNNSSSFHMSKHHHHQQQQHLSSSQQQHQQREVCKPQLTKSSSASSLRCNDGNVAMNDTADSAISHVARTTMKPYLYQQAIKIHIESMCDGHIPSGTTISLIIIFNLALAYHLHALHRLEQSKVAVDENEEEEATTKSYFKRALQLYELAYQIQFVEYDDDDELSTTTTRPAENNRTEGFFLFTMIITNNVSQIHKTVQNHKKHQICLQHLLSTMMCWIVLDKDDSENDLTWYDPSMDGFFRNTSQLILQDNVAAAA